MHELSLSVRADGASVALPGPAQGRRQHSCWDHDNKEPFDPRDGSPQNFRPTQRTCGRVAVGRHARNIVSSSAACLESRMFCLDDSGTELRAGRCGQGRGADRHGHDCGGDGFEFGRPLPHACRGGLGRTEFRTGRGHGLRRWPCRRPAAIGVWPLPESGDRPRTCPGPPNVQESTIGLGSRPLGAGRRRPPGPSRKLACGASDG